MSDRIEFRNTSLPVIVHAYPSGEQPGTWVVIARLTGPDRDTGEPGYYSVRDRHVFDGEPTRERLAAWARSAAVDILLHEVDEALHVDGVRVRDPHAKGDDDAE